MKYSLEELLSWISKQAKKGGKWPNIDVGNILCTTIYNGRLRFVTGGMSLDILKDHPGLYFEVDEANRMIVVNGEMAVKY